MKMKTHFGAELVSRITRSLPSRRLQVGHWLGKIFVPTRPFVGTFREGYLEVRPGETACYLAYITGVYEREVTNWLVDRAARRPPALAIDVGANFGYYPLLLGSVSRGETLSIAFEPDPVTYGWLERNLALNPGLPVRAIQAAIGDVDDGSVPFLASEEGRSLWSRVGPAPDGPDGGVVMVPTLTLDTFIEREGYAEVPLVLIDVEGYEGHVLRGMQRGLGRGAYRAILLEIHPWAFDGRGPVDELIASVTDHGYRAFRFHHYRSPTPDKDPAYYAEEFDPSTLHPADTENLGEWEHFLLVAPGEDPYPPGYQSGSLSPAART